MHAFVEEDRPMRTWFLSSEYPECPAERGYFHVIPVPLERTVSYGSGTAAGPHAILEASAQLETIVESYGEPGALGIHTTEPIDCTSDAIATVFASIARRIGHAWSLQAIPILLGGEHSITNGAIAAIASCHPPGEVGILQFDAHMDLRHAYEGTVHSHGSVMRRALETGMRLHQVGIRNYSVEELVSPTMMPRNSTGCVTHRSTSAHSHYHRISPASFTSHSMWMDSMQR